MHSVHDRNFNTPSLFFLVSSQLMGHLQILFTVLKQPCCHWIKKNTLIQFLTKNISHIPISVGRDDNMQANSYIIF